jgi:ADP-ribose pyrophosphatase
MIKNATGFSAFANTAEHLMTENDVDIVERDTAFQGYFRIDRYVLRHRLFNGGWSVPITREVFERGHSVAVLLYDPAEDAIAVIEQFRAGAMAAGLGPWTIECVAGIIGAGETPEQVARREAAEETACVLGRVEPIGRFIYSPGGCTETCCLFVGEFDSRTASGVHGLAEEHEDIKIHVVPVETAIGWLDRGRIENAALLIAVSWLARNRDQLRIRWSTPETEKVAP